MCALAFRLDLGPPCTDVLKRLRAEGTRPQQHLVNTQITTKSVEGAGKKII